ncbi:MAG: hypothetical protein KZY55_06610 [Paeniclostridium sp.]|nr:hypothetical protein [Paeniclostridium sp.]MBW4862960.1 hypothetical protein [Paeniclostridium sp.]MBW4873721.1 hypothetical protein [Paeniclostridium sp.]
MLQVISGKFFKTSKDEDLHITPRTYIVYSNVLITETINTNIFSIEPIYTRKTINTYLVKYSNKIEKQKDSEFQLNAIGDNEIINDIMACMSLFFMGIFTTDKDYLANLIIESDEKIGRIESPKKLASYIFDKDKFNSETEEKIIEFDRFINKIVSLSRSDYKKIIEVIRQFYKVVLLVNVNLDLAYSTLVAGIESLATKYDSYETDWQDIDSNFRKDMEQILPRLSEEDSNLIKQAIINNTHSKLKQRYCKYCDYMIKDDYFIEYIINKNNSAKKTELLHAIKIAYDLRSKYVHTFKKIGDEISIFSAREICYIKGIPHITLNGLIRLFRYITLKTIHNLEDLDSEQFNYFEELPQSILLTVDNMSPELWLWNEKNYTLELSLKYLNGLILHICSVYIGQENAFLDLKKVCDRIESLLKGLNGNTDNKKNLIMFYLIYNELLKNLNQEYTSKNYENILNKNRALLEEIDIKSLAYNMLFEEENKIDIKEIENIYNKYNKDKYKKNKIQLPRLLETNILVELLNGCIDKNDSKKYEYYLSKLIGENPGNEYIINKIKSYYENGTMEKIHEIYEIYDNNYSKKKWILCLLNIAKYNGDIGKYEKYINEIYKLNPKNEKIKKLLDNFTRTKNMEYIANIPIHIFNR